MTPRPIHHWKTFWLGLFVLAFLGSSWIKSSNGSSSLTWLSARKDKAAVAGQRHGLVKFEYYAHPHPTALRTGLSIRSETGDHPRTWIQPAIASYNKDNDGWEISIAHWLIILLYLIAWLTTITWWHRRQRRLLESHASPPSP